MLKKIISLFLIVCLLSTLIGCGGGNPVVPTDNEESGDEIIYIQDTNLEDNVLVIAGKNDGEAITILGEKDAFGNPIKITGVMYISEQGNAFIMDAGDDGLPTYIIDSEGNKVIFTNYSESTVEISIYNSNEELLQGPTTITIDPSDLTTLKQLYSSVNSKNKDTVEVLEFILKYGGLSLSVFACLSALSSGIVLIIAKVCASTLVSVVVTFYPGTIDNLIVSSVGFAKCFGALTKPWEMLACAGSIWSLINLAYEELVQAIEEKKIENVISGIVSAMNEQDWNKARSYCVYNSPIYYDICELEEQSYLNEVYYNYFVNIDKIIINYEYAELYGNMTTVQIINSIVIYEKTDALVCYFHKIDNNWKIYETIPGYNPTT